MPKICLANLAKGDTFYLAIFLDQLSDIKMQNTM